MTGPPAFSGPLPRSVLPVGGAAVFVACLAVFSSMGGPHGPAAGLVTVLDLVLRAGLPAAAYLLAGVGLGEVFAPAVRGSRDAGMLRAALGLGLMLSISHGLGCLGLLTGRLGTGLARLVCIGGLALLARRLAAQRGRLAEVRVPLSAALAIPAAALLLVAACNPPGWLWDSEAGGYDVLEYHLRLPQEWLRLGRIRPVEHNVYSFLPGYIEAAFVHLAAMMGAPTGPTAGSRAWGLLAGDGTCAIACQLLSCGAAITAAVMIARLAAGIVAEILGKVGPIDDRHVTGAVWLAGVLLLCTPWAIVVGSLAYNDMGVLVFLVGALGAALDRGLTPVRRGAVVGLLVGFACGCKPTALFMAGLPAGVVLLARGPGRQWPAAVSAGVLAGAIAIAPWTVRNWLTSGNPVFPFAASVFGTAHWTAEQVQRYQAAHLFHGSLAERLRLLVFPDRSDPGGGYRGLSHIQWFAFFPACMAGGIAAMFHPRVRPAGMLLLAAVCAQLAAWLFLTHIQSRFLLPLAVPGCILFALGVEGRSSAGGRAGRWAAALAAAVVLVQLGASIAIFLRQRESQPNALLLAGPAVRTGEAFTPEQRQQALGTAGPEQFINFTAPPGRLVYLLGDATALYFTADIVYNTTWDRWPLGEAIRADPGDPAAWTRRLREGGISLVLINFNELGRLSHSGYADPAVTPQAVRAWLQSGPRPVRSWGQDWLLVELPGDGP